MQTGQQIALLLEVGDDDIPGEVRMRQLLKHAGRALRLRCLHVGTPATLAAEVARRKTKVKAPSHDDAQDTVPCV